VDNIITHSADGEPALSAYLNQTGCREGLPITGNFELTSRCNFNCPMCYIHTQHSPAALRQRELTAEQWLSIASDARDMGMVFLLLTGGEPLVREDFPLLYENLVKLGLMVSVNTNASLYDGAVREVFRRYPPARIHATLYGGNQKTYTAQCGVPHFDRVMNNLRLMKEDGLQVGLNLSLTPRNAGDLELMNALARRLEMPVRAAAYMYPPVRAGGAAGINPGRFDPEQAGQIMARWYRLRDGEALFRARVETLSRSAAPTEGSFHCRAGRSSFWMTWDGRMLPCGTMEAEPAFPLREGFAAAWERVRKFSAAIPEPEPCRACPHRLFCPVCPAVCACETGRFDLAPDYLCRMTDSMIQTILNYGRETDV